MALSAAAPAAFCNSCRATGELLLPASGLVHGSPRLSTARPQAAHDYLTKAGQVYSMANCCWPLPPIELWRRLRRPPISANQQLGLPTTTGNLHCRQETIELRAQIAGHVADHRPAEPARHCCTARPGRYTLLQRVEIAPSLTCTKAAERLNIPPKTHGCSIRRSTSAWTSPQHLPRSGPGESAPSSFSAALASAWAAARQLSAVPGSLSAILCRHESLAAIS